MGSISEFDFDVAERQLAESGATGERFNLGVLLCLVVCLGFWGAIIASLDLLL